MGTLRERTCLPRFAWRRQVIEDMQLRGFSPRTQQAYSRAVHKLAEYYHNSPDLVTEEELRQYFLHRTNVSGWSRVACTIALCGIKFFYEQSLRAVRQNNRRARNNPRTQARQRDPVALQCFSSALTPFRHSVPSDNAM
jgi:hypothetical protein